MREKIIITGSSGFLGTALVKYLLKTKKYDVVGIDRKEQTVKDKHYIHIKEDLTKDIPKIDGNIYAVVHLAAIPGVRESHEQFFDYAINNIYVTQKVLKLCIEQWKPQKFLFASSSSIYNSEEEISEAYPYNPVSPYAVTKITGEYLIDCYRRNGLLKGIQATNMRIFTVYGPGQREQLAIQAFIQNILKDKPVEIHGSGNQERDFVYIDDFCSAVEHLIDFPLWESSLESSYNICTGEYHNLHTILRLISKISGKSICIEYKKKNIYDVKRTWGNNNRLKDDTGWEPKMDFEEGIRRQIEWNLSILKNQ